MGNAAVESDSVTTIRNLWTKEERSLHAQEMRGESRFFVGPNIRTVEALLRHYLFLIRKNLFLVRFHAFLIGDDFI